MNGLMATYARLPIGFTHGEGAWLYDSKGERYFDALSGIAVCGLGHNHPAVTRAITEQASKLLHTSNLYQIPLQERLADRLTRITGLNACFFGNSGAEANEAAIKLARLEGHRRGWSEANIIVVDGGFHGRTMATLSATGNAKVHAGFEPLVSGFVRVPYNDIDAIKAASEKHPHVVAILVEPILGEGGIVVPNADYLPELRALCDEREWLLMLDEIQTGNGRTGEFFAFQHSGIKPDVLNTAKGLGNGFPIGACIAGPKAAELFHPGHHGSTFGGNPLASAVGLAVLDTIEQDQLLDRANHLGQLLLEGFKENLSVLPQIVDIRGKGLMIGIELNRDCTALVSKALERHLLINVTQSNIVRLLPPLIMSDAEAEELVDKISNLIIDHLSGH